MNTSELDHRAISHDATPEMTGEIDCRVAATFAEHEAAFRLVYNAYLTSGLGKPNAWRLRVTPYHLLPTTKVFIAVRGGAVLLTYTVVMDGELGVPMESVYGREVDRLRQAGIRFGEASCFADRRDLLNGSLLPAFLGVSRLVAQYTSRRGIHRILAAMHPRHARFYQRILGFEQFGEEKSYPSVGYRPAVAMNLDFVRLPRHRPDCHEVLFGKAIEPEKLLNRPMSQRHARYFARAVDPSLALVPLGETEELRRDRRKPPTDGTARLAGAVAVVEEPCAPAACALLPVDRCA